MFDQVTLDATCTKPVRKHLICSCGYKKEEEVIPEKVHADFVKTVGKEATEGEEMKGIMFMSVQSLMK